MNQTSMPAAAVLAGSGLLFLLLALPLVAGRIPMNRFYGVRFREAFASETDWYIINRYGAWQLISWSVVLLVAGMGAYFLPLGPDWLVPLLLVPALAALASGLATYRFAKKRARAGER